MSDDLPHVSLSFGAFACEIEGIEDPVPLLQRLVAFCEEVEQRNPAFGQRIIPLAELNSALQTEGPVEARVDGDVLTIRKTSDSETVTPAAGLLGFGKAKPDAPQEVAPTPLPGEISSLKELEEKAKDLPEDQLASALDRAMTAGPAKTVPSRNTTPVLSVADYAVPRMPRTTLQALEIAAAWRHHIQGQAQFDRATLLADAGQIATREANEMSERIDAFDMLLAQAVLRPADQPDHFTLSPAVIARFAR